MEKCFVLFPGKFKPVHEGHIMQMEKYLQSKKYNVDLTIIISKTLKEGLLPETSKWFLDKIFIKNPKVHVIVSEDKTPILTVYNITGEKQKGDGIYAMASSSKGTDIKRSEDFVQKFSTNGKYYTPGIETIFFPIDVDPINYRNRNDLYDGTPISSTIIRNDIRNNDFLKFKTAYTQLLKNNVISEATLKEYFNKLKTEILSEENKRINDSVCEQLYIKYNNILNEGGAAGHMLHPYEVNDFTFNDIRNLINDLFYGHIHDITEKLDGQNLFASVDIHGNTIFARNKTDIKGIPLGMMDIKTKWQEKPDVQKVFSKGADIINAVFNNIPNKIKFFNEPKKWVNLEILDNDLTNVISYTQSTISFHGFKVIDNDDIVSSTDSNDMKILSNAINKTDKKFGSAQITPKIILKNIEQNNKLISKYYKILDNILKSKNLSEHNTIGDFKKNVLYKHISKRKEFDFISGELQEVLLNRWALNDKSITLTTIKKSYKNEEGRTMLPDEARLISAFEKEELNKIVKSEMFPIDNMFINLGNDVIKIVSGLVNQGHENEVIGKLKKEVNHILNIVDKEDDDVIKKIASDSLYRLQNVANIINATEGIVFNYKGYTLKLTGSFAPLNQLLGIKYRLKK